MARLAFSGLRWRSAASILVWCSCASYLMPGSSCDLALFKQFQIRERSKLQFRWEVFNLPNTPSFAAPASTLDTSTVGRVTSTSTAPRQMQLALKLTF